MADIRIKDILSTSPENQEITVCGWVRTRRGSKNVSFVALNDGSTVRTLQIVAEHENFNEETLKRITTGSALEVKGKLVASGGSGQSVELIAHNIDILGDANADDYPLQPKKHSLEFLREIAHLRPRTSTFSSVLRIRHSLAFAIHNYFNQRGFYYLHTPIITGSDAEGAGEMFSVTNMDLKDIPKTEEGEVDYKKDFFSKATHLTVSGQLEAELGALALSKVYTFGPTFRAENSNTSRHLAEFWMIEPEMAFADLEDDMNLAEDFLKYLISYVLEHNNDDLEFLENRLIEEEKGKPQEERNPMKLRDKLTFIVNESFERISYTDAFYILRNSKPNKKKKFQFPIDEWGADLQSEHERFLVEKHFAKPVIVFDYPSTVKAFYMRENEDGKTVRAMDILFPGIGEIVGGSQREERYDVLKKRINDFGIDEKEVWWYLETRKFGTVPHSGFGLGFERLVQFATGMQNIRDVIPFPRTPGNAEF